MAVARSKGTSKVCLFQNVEGRTSRNYIKKSAPNRPSDKEDWQEKLEKNSSSQESGTKANALFCPICCVEYEEVEFDFEVDGVVLRNVKALRCPTCNEERFTTEQYAAIAKRIDDSVKQQVES